MERTFVMVKPDGVKRSLVGEIMSRLERRGLKMVGARFMLIDRPLAESHYGVHRGKPFFDELVKYITSGPVLASVWEGPGAVEAVRAVVGATDPSRAAPGTIRGDFGLEISRNLIHASDAPETAAAEVDLFFGDGELVDYSTAAEPWVHPR